MKTTIDANTGPLRKGGPGGPGGHGPASFCLSNISVFGIFTNTALGTTVPHLISY